MKNISKEDNNYIYFMVGKNVKKYRKLRGITQKELANRCNYSENFIGDIENNTFKTFSLNDIYHISKVWGIHIKLLFEEIDDEDQKK